MSFPFGLTPEVLAAAAAEPDPDAPAATTRLRRQYPAEIVGPALGQARLRRRARAKFGSAAATMFFTADGLEQASRPTVAVHHAHRLRAAGADHVVDLGCGIGTDALAFAAAGLRVTALDRDPQTVAVARANLPDAVEVITADATTYPIPDDAAVFLDPARRTARGRSWRLEDLSPPWSFVLRQLARDTSTGVKLGPGFPLTQIPTGVEAEWIADRGDTVELALWSGPGAVPGRRSVLVLPDHRLVADPRATLGVEQVGAVLYEPVGAVTRSGALASLAAELGASAVHPRLPYLSGPELSPTPFATAFTVLESWPYREKDLRAWVRERDIGTLEILTRGLDLDPAELRRRLRPKGRNSATVAISPSVSGKQVLVLERAPSKFDADEV